jgi:hypothetical protein
MPRPNSLKLSLDAEEFAIVADIATRTGLSRTRTAEVLLRLGWVALNAEITPTASNTRIRTMREYLANLATLEAANARDNIPGLGSRRQNRKVKP